MKISLITATLGRVDEIERLLISLTKQTYQNFELIIIDQNSHFDVSDIVNKYIYLIDIKYIRSSIKGLSYNRNVGLRQISGDVIGFPDDDCFYQNDVLNVVVNNFIHNNIKFCALPVYDTINMSNRYIYKQDSHLSRKDIFKFLISFNFFIVKNDVSFDEQLGVGAYFSSGEETDYLLENINKDDKGIFISQSGIHHIHNDQHLSNERAFKYALGFGAIFKKEIFLRKNFFYLFKFLYYLMRSVIGIVLYPSKSKLYLSTLKGRILGFRQFSILKASKHKFE